MLHNVLINETKGRKATGHAHAYGGSLRLRPPTSKGRSVHTSEVLDMYVLYTEGSTFEIDKLSVEFVGQTFARPRT